MVIVPNLEPQVWTRGGLFNDVDAQAAQFHGYDQRYQQLSRGPFQGQFRSFVFGDDLSIHLEQANRALAQAASTPAGRFGISLLSQDSPPSTFNAETFSQDHVALCPANMCLEAKTAEGLNICCIDLSCELLPDEGLGLRSANIFTDVGRSALLRDLVQSGLDRFTTLSSVETYPAAVKAFKSSLADLLWQITNARAKPQDTSTSCTRALHIFRVSRDYIHEGLQNGISIVTLCRNVGVSRRTLERIFRSVVGTGPGDYIRTLQLNHIRRDLILPINADLSIGDIAARHGIWHWSRFANRYRLLFGELPSQTRISHGIGVALKSS